MKKTANQHVLRKMTLRHETIRHLASDELAQIAGGILTEALNCVPTVHPTCVPKTPSCPM